jgi:hypothetical protein
LHECRLRSRAAQPDPRLFLDRRAFLVSYDANQNQQFEQLDQLLVALGCA